MTLASRFTAFSTVVYLLARHDFGVTPELTTLALFGGGLLVAANAIRRRPRF